MPSGEATGVKTMIWTWRGRLLAVCAACIALASERATAADLGAADVLILHLMAAYNVPGAAVALIKDGRVVLERGYGFRDLASRAPVTAATLFNIGSISKSFTALGIAQLADQHQVDLDTPIIRYLPELRLSDQQAAQAMTLRQLLSHTSGLPPDDRWPEQVPPTREGIIGEFAAMPITAKPGMLFQYCSRCIVLAAYVLERVAGQSWETYTRTHIFEPLGMTAASFGPLGLAQAPDAAQPYRHDAVLGDVPAPWSRLEYLQPLAPAGGIDANIDEMAHYALLQLSDGTLSDHQLLSAQMTAELHRPEVAVGADWSPAAPAENMHYALGWFTADIRGLHLVFHNGANPGYRAAIVLAPSAKAAVIVLTNGESDRFTDEATQSLLKLLIE